MQLLLIHIVLTSCFTSSQTNVDHGIFADGGALCPHKKKDLKKYQESVQTAQNDSPAPCSTPPK